MEIFDIIYGACSGEKLLALGATFESKKTPGAVGVKYLVPFRVKDRSVRLPVVFDRDGDGSQYLLVNTLQLSALPGRSSLVGTWAEYLSKGRSYVAAKTSRLAELNGIVGDLDVGRPDRPMTPETALNALLTMCRGGELVYPSLIAFSGRGAYAVWLLCEESGGKRPPKASRSALKQWKAVARELVGSVRISHPSKGAELESSGQA